ncbi:protoporphyrinogen/coproporphyrinogen oxidase [Thermoproteota archaeon]
MKKIAIIGAGPTGLGAAYRLKELNHNNFTVYERNPFAGGLCASFEDDKGFTWDLGGHVIFSHYKYFDDILDYCLSSDYVEHKRQAWIRTKGLWVPYPFQNNIKYLPKQMLKECLDGLKRLTDEERSSGNFQEWIVSNLGDGIAKHFMIPYNNKVWAHSLASMSTTWMDERVSRIDLKKIIAQLDDSDTDSTNWGPNAVFRYPLHGGTGAIFKKITSDLSDKIEFNSQVTKIDPQNKTIHFNGEKKDSYDAIINTSPLDKLLGLIKGCNEKLIRASDDLKYSGVFVVGIGIKQPSPSNKCWIYFPDQDSPFFRVTYLSNYSPYNSPSDKTFYSLLCESSYSEHKNKNKSEIVEETICGLINSGLIKEEDKKSIVSTFLFDIDYAYPTPTLKRDGILKTIQPELEKLEIYSRGRFGAWKYEIANTDHCVLQGKEAADRIIQRSKENTWTL